MHFLEYILTLNTGNAVYHTLLIAKTFMPKWKIHVRVPPPPFPYLSLFIFWSNFPLDYSMM